MKECSRKKGRRTSGRAIAFGLIATIVLGLAITPLIAFYRRSTPAAAGAVSVRISMSGFTPKEIHAKVGQPLQIELINLDNSMHSDGGGWHNMVIERLGINQYVAPTGRVVFTITPTEPGEYDFYCDICCGGKENPFMHGRLIVS